jgi:transketolase
VSWRCAIERRNGPSCLVFSRQNLAHQARSAQQVEAIARGGYVLHEPEGGFDLVLIGTGSEVEMAMQAAKALAAEGIRARVVSMPCTNRFDHQPAEYRESVLPAHCRKRVAIEAGVTDYWRKYVGLDGAVIGIDSFGASAPIDALYRHFGITIEAVVAAAKALR